MRVSVELEQWYGRAVRLSATEPTTSTIVVLSSPAQHGGDRGA